ncbi:MAG: hypothetical protein WC028_01540 [Candidatus Obscuribacterales bacterium]
MAAESFAASEAAGNFVEFAGSFESVAAVAVADIVGWVETPDSAESFGWVEILDLIEVADWAGSVD